MDGISASGFCSILWPGAAPMAADDGVAQPDCFADLNLDQVEDAITAAWPAEHLAPFFRAPLHDVSAVDYRQAVIGDLADAATRRAVTACVEGMRDVHARLAGIEKLQYRYEKECAHLAAAKAYCATMQALAHALERLPVASAGLRGLRTWLVQYAVSGPFQGLASEAGAVLSAFGKMRYGLLIRGSSVTVRRFEDEADARVEVADVFAGFQHHAVGNDRVRPTGRIGIQGLNHIEAQILDRVALLYPQAFAALDAFCEHHAAFITPLIARFAREACFYLAWLRYIEPLEHAGLRFCRPSVSAQWKAIACENGFDIALAATLGPRQRRVVCNSFALDGPERILVVSGPNHGGKTTFARMWGQLHWLAALGLTVPGTRARLFLFDRLFTHFEREEHIETLRGKLKDDLVRMHGILTQATSRSLIVINEIFASTTLADAVRLGRGIMARVSALDALAVCVTFLVELADYDSTTVSLVAAVDPRDPAVRTFALERRPADGLAHALAVARKYRVTQEALLHRIAP